MSVQTYGCNHVALEVTDIDQDQTHAFLYLGEHQFLALAKVEEMPRRHNGHFGIMVRDADEVEEVRRKVGETYGLPLDPAFRCDFRDPFGNRVQVGDLHDESLIWLLPYRECQKASVVFSDDADQGDGWQGTDI